VSLADAWRDALEGMTFEHLDRSVTPTFEIIGGVDSPALAVSAENAVDTVTGQRIASLKVSTVQLSYFPGKTVARRWLAAAWAGYMQHEALELVRIEDGTRPIDPHGPDVELDRGLRHGLPVVLTPESMLRSFCAVMPEERARQMVGG
jgi:hypothetical protein